MNLSQMAREVHAQRKLVSAGVEIVRLVAEEVCDKSDTAYGALLGAIHHLSEAEAKLSDLALSEIATACPAQITAVQS